MEANSIKTEKVVVILLTLWGLFIYWLGYVHFYASIPRPIFGASVMAIIVILLTLYFKIKRLKNLLNSIPLQYMALFQSWRIFAGLVILIFKDSLPPAFVHEAPWGDIITGFAGIAVFVFLQNKIGYWVVNIIGIIDLISALSIGMYYAVNNASQMNTMISNPLILIPLFGVPIAVLTHVISFSLLLKKD